MRPVLVAVKGERMDDRNVFNHVTKFAIFLKSVDEVVVHIIYEQFLELSKIVDV